MARFCDYRARRHSTSGGFRETEVNELTVTPAGRPSLLRVVTIVTPVANCPRARRNSFSSNLAPLLLVMRGAIPPVLECPPPFVPPPRPGNRHLRLPPGRSCKRHRP